MKEFRAKDIDENEEITKELIAHTFNMIFSAGTDTTARLVSFFLYLMGEYPEI
jgi:cytochrome P450